MTVIFMSYDIFNGEFLQHDTKRDALDYLYDLYPNKIRYNRYLEQELQFVTDDTIYLLMYRMSKANIYNHYKKELIVEAFYDYMLVD